MKRRDLSILAALGLTCAAYSQAETKILVEHHPNDQTTASFRCKTVSGVRRADAASQADFTVIDGQRDPNSGNLDQLRDGRLPNDEDQPGANFFFRAGSDGGRIRVDLGNIREVKQINTYSWHDGTRGPQVYTLYASDGRDSSFNNEPKRDVDPTKCGWKLVAGVDTRPSSGEPGGQYAVSIQDSAGALGTYRYLLFDIRQTEARDPFGNTFYSEIDVVDNTSAAEATVAENEPTICEDSFEVSGYTITLETTETPDLTEWVRTKVQPMAREWYPKLVELFPSAGFSAPRTVRITFSKDMKGVAATGGSRIRCAAGWFRQNLDGEALGAVFHELVHVVQQYGRARLSVEGATRPPGWLVEGIADYTRWYKFEPQSHGAEVTSRNIARARYDASYRVTANFLNWSSETYDKDLVPQLNTAIREGRYNEQVWKERTGHTVQELGAEWKSALEKKVTAAAGDK